MGLLKKIAGTGARLQAGISSRGMTEILGLGGKIQNIGGSLGGGLEKNLFGQNIPGGLNYLDVEPEIKAAQEEARKMALESLRSQKDIIDKLESNEDIISRIGLQGRTALRSASEQAQEGRRKLQGEIARRGLGGSSVGLGQFTSLERDTQRRLGEIQEQIPLLQQQALREARGQRLSELAGLQAGSLGLIGTSGARRQLAGVTPASTSGGLAPLLGMAGGAYLGSSAGPQGAAYGAGTGMGLGQLLSGAFGG